jgi:NAD(P)-dependent dehydrogenase (short-subunit alcohol dehydrogenase family)
MGVFDGKVAIVTGIGSGMGRSIALKFASEGASLVLGARRESVLQEIAAEVREVGPEPLVCPVDLGNEDSCNNLVAQALERFGGVDIFVQNGHNQGDWKAAMESTAQVWREAIEVNLIGAFVITQGIVGSMRARGGGAIVFVNSGAMFSNPPMLGSYSASKAALASLGRTLAVELGHDGIRVNNLTLGATQGENTNWFMGKNKGLSDDEVARLVDEKGSAIPIGHMPTPEECAGAVFFLCSPLAAAVTGQNVNANGGQWVATGA